MSIVLKWGLRSTVGIYDPFALFIPAVAFSAWREGLWSGVAATVLAAFAVEFLFIAWVPSFFASGPGNGAQLALFAFDGALVSLISAFARRAWQRVSEARRRLELLAEASEILASSFDLEFVMARVSRLAVSEMADWCVVDVTQENGKVNRVAVAHGDPHKVNKARRLQQSKPGADLILDQVLRSGEPIVVREVTEPHLRSTIRDEEQCRLFVELGIQSTLVVPFKAQGGAPGKTLGAIRLAWAHPRRHREQDLSLAVELAHRCTLAIENAQLFSGAARAVEQEERAAHEAREAKRLGDEFLSVASHELRTPTTALHLQLQILKRELNKAIAAGQAPQGLAHRLEQAERQYRRLSRLLEELLDVSRLRLGRLDLQHERLDLSEVAREVTARFADEAFAAGCELTFHAQGMASGRWDRLRVEQVLDNLLSNAIKYGRGKPIAVVVDGEPDAAYLTVRDDGIGIAPENQKRIFERFERAVDHQEFDGMGLGLYIVKQIVDAMGGSIHLLSEPNAGTTITVVLPYLVRSEQRLKTA